MSDQGPKDRISDQELSRVRTRLAADRTLMAWMRTSVSLIGFGFSIFKFFQYLEKSGLVGDRWKPHEPRLIGLTLIIMGLGFLLLGLLEYGRFLKRLGERARDGWATLTAAALLWGVGFVTLMTLVLRTGR